MKMDINTKTYNNVKASTLFVSFRSEDGYHFPTLNKFCKIRSDYAKFKLLDWISSFT